MYSAQKRMIQCRTYYPVNLKQSTWCWQSCPHGKYRPQHSLWYCKYNDIKVQYLYNTFHLLPPLQAQVASVYVTSIGRECVVKVNNKSKLNSPHLQVKKLTSHFLCPNGCFTWSIPLRHKNNFSPKALVQRVFLPTQNDLSAWKYD